MHSPAQSGTTRREFLVRSAATATGGFLSIGLPGVLASGKAEAAAGTGMSSFTPSIWFTITPDGKTTMHIVKAEMGQHVGTGLAQVIAEELELNWADVRLDTPLESVENFAVYGLAYTVNSGSITTEFDRLSRAGAAGRIALIEAGAEVLGAKQNDCYAEMSRVIGSYKIIGKSMPALDIPAKTNGQAKYGIDVFLPNMVYGALVIPRTRYGSKVVSIDDSEARKIPGFVKAVKIDDRLGKCTGWVVALADKFPAAVKAARALKLKVDPGPYGNLGLADIFADFANETKNADAGANWVLEGDVDKGLADAEQVLEMEYTTDMVCHATMEPLNATVQIVDGAWHVYAGTQSTSFARMTLSAYLSKVLNQKPEDIKIYVHEHILGGGFGGKQDYDEILAAAYCAKEVGRPVKLIQTRESTFATSFPRTPTYHKLKAGLKNGELLAMNHDICCGWMGPRFSVGKKFGTDWLQLDSWDAKKEDIDQWSIGGSDHWYDVKNHRVRAWNSDRTTWAVQASALRTVSNSYNMFVVESFMDEVAHALARLRVRHRRRRASPCQLPPGRCRESGLGREEAAAQYRHGNCRLLSRGAAEPDLGRRHCRSHGRSQDRHLQNQPDHHRDGSRHGRESFQCQGADPGRGSLGRKSDHVGAADLQEWRDRADQLPRLPDDPSGRRARDRGGADPIRSSSERRGRAGVHRRRPGSGQRHLQRGRRARAAYANHSRGDPGGVEEENVIGVATLRSFTLSACASVALPGERTIGSPGSASAGSS